MKRLCRICPASWRMFLLRARAWPAFWTTGRNALHGSGIRNCGQKLPGVSPRELISRGGVVLALPAARELIDAGYAAGHYRVWAPRADAVAKALLAEHQYTSAYDYLKTAEEGYEKEGMAEPLVRTLQTMSSIDQMLNRNEQANMLLQRAVDAAAHLGPDALPVRSRLLAAQGRLARTTGRIPESREYFKKALALCPQPTRPLETWPWPASAWGRPC